MKELRKTFITFLLYLFLPTLVIIGLQVLFNFQYDKTNISHLIWLNFGADAVFFILFIIINRDVLLKFKPIKGNNLTERIINYVVTIIIVTLIFYAVKIFFSIVASIISIILGVKQISNNQELLELTFKSAPILMTISGVIFAPVIEEIVFRGTIRRVIKNKWVFVIVSGLLFGLVHVLRHDLPVFVILISGVLLDIIITSTLNKQKKIGLSLCTKLVMTIVMLLGLQVVTGDLMGLILSIQLSEVVNSIVYIAAGLYLALVYAKYDNIYITIGCHMINNLLAYILLFTM